MRLIDADTLKAYFFRPYSNEESYSNTDIEKIIDKQITIKQERKTGKWILAHSTCSICNWYSTNRYGFIEYANYNYCPNCGAKMEVGNAELQSNP